MTEEEITNHAINKMLAEEVRLFRAPHVADKIEAGVDTNPRTQAAIRIIRKLSGLPVSEIAPPRQYIKRLPPPRR